MRDDARDNSNVEREALELLYGPNIFGNYLDAVRRLGLVGEKLKAIVILIVIVSRLLARPLNLLVKGQSSAGKNFLVNCCIQLCPEDAVRALTSSSTRSWNYAEDYFCHRVVYLKERNETAGNVHPIRLLISENVLTHQVTVNEGNERVMRTVFTRGPIASISTTKENQLEADDESRNISIWIDESEKQTKRIIAASTIEEPKPSQHEIQGWHAAHALIQQQAQKTLVLPDWLHEATELVNTADLRARRYFPAFITGCKSIALLRSFRRKAAKDHDSETINVRFSDYALAALIFQPVFEASLLGNDNRNISTRDAIKDITTRKRLGADVNDLMGALGVEKDDAYARLRAAEGARLIRRANAPERGNRKLYLPAPSSCLIPDAERVFRRFPEIGERVRLRHPITGEWIVYERG